MMRYRSSTKVPGRNRPSSKDPEDTELRPEVCDEGGLNVGPGRAAITIVSAIETSGFGVNTDPQEPQKRLLSNISDEHVGHLIIYFSLHSFNGI
jgi:hypothetical protein